MRYPWFLVAMLVITLGLAQAMPAQATTMAARVVGKIVLDVENSGEAWYIYPPTQHRYYLGRPDDAFNIMRYLGLGITDADLAKIPSDTTLSSRLAGYILLQVQQHGEAWYVYPGDDNKYYLGRPDDAFSIMTRFGLGITSSDLMQIPIATDFLSVGTSTAAVTENFTLSNSRGSFAISEVTIPKAYYTMVTDTGNTADCLDNCAARSLADYILENSAEIGIHGTYFCPPDYSSCASSTYSFDAPVYNTAAGVMINAGKLPFHDGPMIAVGGNGQYYYYHRTIDFGYSASEFEQRTGTTLQAAMANTPALIEAGQVVVESEPLDSKQRDVKSGRGGIGYNDNSVFLVIAQSATVIDLAYIFQTLGADYAMNLDGGGSTALYSEGKYQVGPGRLLPNAILFRRN